MSNEAKPERPVLLIKANGRLVLLRSQDDQGPVVDVTGTAHQHLFDVCTCQEPMLINDLFRFFAKQKKMISVFMAVRPAERYIDIWQRTENKHPNPPGTYVLPTEYQESAECITHNVATLRLLPGGVLSFDCLYSLGGMGSALEFMPFAVARSLQFVNRCSVTLADLIDLVLFELTFTGGPEPVAHELFQRMGRDSMEELVCNRIRDQSTESESNSEPKTAAAPRLPPPQVKKEWSRDINYLCPGGLLFRHWRSIETVGDGGGWIDVSKHSVNFLLGWCKVEQDVTYGDLFRLMGQCEDVYNDIYERSGLAKWFGQWHKHIRAVSDRYDAMEQSEDVAREIYARGGLAQVFAYWREQNRAHRWNPAFLNELPQVGQSIRLGKLIADALQSLALSEAAP